MVIHNVLNDAGHVVEWILTQVTQEHAVLVVLHHVTSDLCRVEAFEAIVAQPTDILAFSVRVNMTLDILNI